jgi:hypothetical protein
MIGHSADRQRFHAALARDAAEVGPEAFANLTRQQRLASFSRKDAMMERTGEGMHSAVPDGTLSSYLSVSQR